MLACESIRFFGFSFTRREKPSLFFGGREATTGSTSVVRRLDLCVLQKNLRLVFVLTKSAKVVVEFSTTFLISQQANDERLKLALIMKYVAYLPGQGIQQPFLIAPSRELGHCPLGQGARRQFVLPSLKKERNCLILS